MGCGNEFVGKKNDFFLTFPEVGSYKDEERALTWAMFDYAFLEPIRCGKNCFILLTGGSREGKSATAGTLIEELLRRKGIEFKDYVNDIFIYTPMEYPRKMQALLHDERLKDIPFAVIDDARFTVSAKSWYSIINRSIAEISSISGRQKTIVLIICTQFLSDLDKDMRRFLNYWGACYRPLHEPTEVRFYNFWHDERDPESVKLKKRPFKGVVVRGKKYVTHIPTKFIFHMPSKEAWHLYDDASFKAKSKLLKSRFDKLMRGIEKEAGLTERVDKMVEFYSDPKMREHIMSCFYFSANKHLKLRKEAFDVLQLDKSEGVEFAQKFSKRLKVLQETEVENYEHMAEEAERTD